MNKYNRFATLPIDQVLPQILANLTEVNVKINHESGYSYGVVSNRLRTFATKAVNGAMCCCACGLKATHFAVEGFRRSKDNSSHINLYGTAETGDVLFTHDHRLARSLGGADNLSNTDIMCSPCNQLKAKSEMVELLARRANGTASLTKTKKKKKKKAMVQNG